MKKLIVRVFTSIKSFTSRPVVKWSFFILSLINPPAIYLLIELKNANMEAAKQSIRADTMALVAQDAVKEAKGWRMMGFRILEISKMCEDLAREED